MTRSVVFLTNFEVFHLVVKHCVECLTLLLKQNDFRRRNYKDAKMSSFSSDFQILTIQHTPNTQYNINLACIFFINY